MRCKNCEHLLFNQPAPAEGASRVCSECGSGYSVADFKFRRGKVQFCCPKCGQAYYGTSPDGHLEPSSFSCVGCGCELDMERCVLRPFGVQNDDDAMQATLVPWEGQGPWFRRWWRTARLGWTGAAIAIEPSPDANPRKALAFLIVTSWLTALPSIVLAAVLWAIGASVSVGNMRSLAIGAGVLDDIAVALVGFMLLPAYNLGFVAAIAGCATLSGVPFRRGVVSCSYASGSQLLQLVPFCGAGVARIVWIVHACRGMSRLAPAGRGFGAGFLALVGAVGMMGAWFVATILVGSLF